MICDSIFVLLITIDIDDRKGEKSPNRGIISSAESVVKTPEVIVALLLRLHDVNHSCGAYVWLHGLRLWTSGLRAQSDSLCVQACKA